VIRLFYYYHLALVRRQQSTPEQIESALAYDILSERIPHLYIVEETKNVLLRRYAIAAQPVLQKVHVLEKGRYLKRWARRLRRNFGFSREVGFMLAYGTFGVDVTRKTVGVDLLVTTDIKLVNEYRQNFPTIHEKLQSLLRNLPSPYGELELPVLRAIGEITE